LAILGISSSSHTLNTLDISSPSIWIIDWSTDHMTYSSKKLVSYTPCLSNKKKTIIDGIVTTIVDQGDVLINDFLTLKNVLHVARLFVNLISIQKLATDSNCSVIFYPSHCEF